MRKNDLKRPLDPRLGSKTGGNVVDIPPVGADPGAPGGVPGPITSALQRLPPEQNQMRLLARCIGHAAAFGDQTEEVGPILLRPSRRRRFMDNVLRSPNSWQTSDQPHDRTMTLPQVHSPSGDTPRWQSVMYVADSTFHIPPVSCKMTRYSMFFTESSLSPSSRTVTLTRSSFCASDLTAILSQSALSARVKALATASGSWPVADQLARSPGTGTCPAAGPGCFETTISPVDSEVPDVQPVNTSNRATTNVTGPRRLTCAPPWHIVPVTNPRFAALTRSDVARLDRVSTVCRLCRM
jgi:hypothetical protein